MTAQQDFVDWLQQELQQRGWNQAELARRSRLTTAQVSRIMTREQKPGPASCQKLAHALHVPAEEVFRRAGLLPKPSLQPPGLDELGVLYSELAANDRKRLLALARALRQAAETD